MPAQQLQATDANGAVTKEAVIVNISVAALGNVQNIQLYFYNETSNGVQGVQTRLKRKDRFESK